MNVFISYSHDNDEHRQAVIALAVHLRARGVTVIADDQHADLPPPKGWLVWMMDKRRRWKSESTPRGPSTRTPCAR